MACCSMFSGGAYSRYSALENPYLVRKTTAAGSKEVTFTERQRQKKSLEVQKLTKANNEVERLNNQVNSDAFQTKHPEYQSERRRELRHQTERAATAQNRVVHYQAKIEKKTAQIK